MHKFVREIVETIILGLLLFLTIQYSLQNFRVEGSSMSPALEGSQHVVVNKLIYTNFPDWPLLVNIPFIEIGPNDKLYIFRSPNRGDVVVFKPPFDNGRDFVKRIIGIPGDTVAILEGTVFVNEKPLYEPYIQKSGNGNMLPQKVTDGAYFVLGDNRPSSNDSRKWGLVPAENIIGISWFSYWPIKQLDVFQIFD